MYGRMKKKVNNEVSKNAEILMMLRDDAILLVFTDYRNSPSVSLCLSLSRATGLSGNSIYTFPT